LAGRKLRLLLAHASRLLAHASWCVAIASNRFSCYNNLIS
jgi:hypothetical protein